MTSRRITPLPQWKRLNQHIESCGRCPRLLDHCRSIGKIRRAAYRSETYWSRPVPNFGSPDASLLILGLAPGAHGANRTGRLFTGDRSGDFLFAAMHAEGFCNQPTSTQREDGLELIDCAITGVAHCAPPGNKPTTEEILNCREFLDSTVDLMPALMNGRGGILVLGKIAFDAAIQLYRRRGWLPPNSPRPTFAHAARFCPPDVPFLLCAYHPSQQNTFTKKLTPTMLRQVFAAARKEIDRRKK